MTLAQLLEAKLKASYAEFAKANSRPSRPNVRLPAWRASDPAYPNRPLIRFDGAEDTVSIRLNAAATIANMQTDAAAFEAWALILRAWCGVVTISLHWDEPEDRSDPHYQRFLYRADHFSNLFDWFHLENEHPLQDARFLPKDRRPLILNLPTQPRRTLEEYQRDKPGWEPKGERQLEITLRDCPGFAALYELDPGRVERQIPVGLFRDRVSAAKVNRVFSGAGSAIDLIGMQATTLWLFELKAGNNASVGAISELFFYACVLRDTGAAGPFRFNKSKVDHSRITELSQCSRIEAVVLGEQIHPLLEHSGITFLLNEAAKNLWGRANGGRTVQFRIDRIEIQTGECSLTRTSVA